MAEKKSKFWPRFWTVVGFGILFGVIVGIISTTIWLFGIIIFRKPLKEAFGDLIGANEGVVATVGDDTNNGGRTDEEQEIEEMLLNNHAKDDIVEIELKGIENIVYINNMFEDCEFLSELPDMSKLNILTILRWKIAIFAQ